MLWASASTFCWLGGLYSNFLFIFLGGISGTLVANSNFVCTRIHIFYEFLWDNQKENVSKRCQNKYSCTSGNSSLENFVETQYTQYHWKHETKILESYRKNTRNTIMYAKSINLHTYLNDTTRWKTFNDDALQWNGIFNHSINLYFTILSLGVKLKFEHFIEHEIVYTTLEQQF